MTQNQKSENSVRNKIQKSSRRLFMFGSLYSLLLAIVIFGFPFTSIRDEQSIRVGWKFFEIKEALPPAPSLPYLLLIIFISFIIVSGLVLLVLEKFEIKYNVTRKINRIVLSSYMLLDWVLLIFAVIGRNIAKNPNAWGAWNNLLIIVFIINGMLFTALIWRSTIHSINKAYEASSPPVKTPSSQDAPKSE